jgi:hypothetical protein
MIILQNNGDLWDLDLKHLNQDIGLSNRGRWLLVIIGLIVAVLLYDDVIIFIFTGCLGFCFVCVLLLLLLDVVADNLIQD